MRIAVIGTGIIGKSHLEAISKSNHCVLDCVCDINEEQARTYAEIYQVPYFTDYHDIPAKTQADAVILNLPHWLHCEVTEFFLNSGLHVLVEKPMAMTKAECDRMIEAAKRSGKKLAVGHPQRFFAVNRKVKEICQSGELGKLCMITEYRAVDYFAAKRPKWFLDKKLSGGGITMNLGAHALDKTFYITDSRPEEIFASVNNFKNDCNIEAHSQILIKLKNQVTASYTFGGYSSVGNELIYYFTHGALKVAGTSKLWKRMDSEWIEVPLAQEGNNLSLQLEAFYQYVNDQPSEIPTGEYGADVIAAIEKIYS